jgi:hypothetical protein
LRNKRGKKRRSKSEGQLEQETKEEEDDEGQNKECGNKVTMSTPQRNPFTLQTGCGQMRRKYEYYEAYVLFYFQFFYNRRRERNNTHYVR